MQAIWCLETSSVSEIMSVVKWQTAITLTTVENPPDSAWQAERMKWKKTRCLPAWLLNVSYLGVYPHMRYFFCTGGRPLGGKIHMRARAHTHTRTHTWQHNQTTGDNPIITVAGNKVLINVTKAHVRRDNNDVYKWIFPSWTKNLSTT